MRSITCTRAASFLHNDYIQILKECIASKSLNQGKTVHQFLLKNTTIVTDRNQSCSSSSVVILDKLTHLYITCSKPQLAQQVFDSIAITEKLRKVILWNKLIRAYAWEGPFDKAIDLYFEMIDYGITPTKYTYPFVLKACSSLRAIANGKEVHDHVRNLGLESDVYICTALIDFYAKCGCLLEAKKVFDQVPKRDVVAWNAIIAGSSLHGLYKDTVKLVVDMQEEGTLSPNSSTIVAVLPLVGERNALTQGKAMHGYCVRRGFYDDVVVETGILDMYGKCGCLNYARKIFNGMIDKNQVTWAAMVGACVLCDSMREAIGLFNQMMLANGLIPSPVTLATVLRAYAKLNNVGGGRQIHGYMLKSASILDIMVSNTLLSMYSKCGFVGDALRLLDEMDFKDNVSYSAIISGCVQNGNADQALKTFYRMQISKTEPDRTTMIAFIPACSQLAALQLGACSHSYSIVHGFTMDVPICNALVDMYAKCGKIIIARLVFDKMEDRDIVSWNAMISGYGIHGLGLDALSLFHDMQIVGLQPDDVTFIGLLTACSHSGLVSEGKNLFAIMTEDFNIIPRMEHYLCMVDLLGRAGLLNEANIFIQRMPFEPDVRVWSALLAACRIHKNVELGKRVSNRIQSLGPESTGNFVLLSNLYSSIGRWGDAEQVRFVQRQCGFKKSPGCSWVEVGGAIHAFVGGDQSHPQSTQINGKLEELLVEMKKMGYQAESGFVYQDVEEEEKEHALLYHSEKLAVAFGILYLNSNKPILVTKNLRVCGDCHVALKYITIITKREIIVRDASRFHHFRNGICNCGDFW